jgi:hypothetical protein
MSRVKSIGLVAAMALCAVNLWTGAPLAAVWVGSRVQGSGPPSMGAVAVVAGVLLLLCLLLVRALSMLEAAYDRSTGAPQHRRRTSPWLRSMRGEREPTGREAKPLTAPERVLVGAVVLGVLAFEVWFFFFAGSSIGSG